MKLIYRKQLKTAYSIEGIFDRLITSGLDVPQHGIEYLPYGGFSLKSSVANMMYVRKLSDPAIHITGDVHYAGLLSKAKVVLTIHDIKSILNGSVIKRSLKYLFFILLPLIKYNKITCISEFTLQELKQITPGFLHYKMSIVRNPISLSAFNTKDEVYHLDLPTHYILHIGTKQNKNLERTALAAKRIGLTLVVLGDLSQSQLTLLSDKDIDYVKFSKLDYSDVVVLYKRSTFVSFISTYEGFGMPIIEAQAAGRPVVTSNIPPMNQVAGEGAILVDPYNLDSIVDGYKKAIDLSYSSKVVAKGYENLQQYSEPIVVNDYNMIYHKLMTI